MKKILFIILALAGISISAFAINTQPGFDTGAIPASQISVNCATWVMNLSCADKTQQDVDNVIDTLSTGGSSYWTLSSSNLYSPSSDTVTIGYNNSTSLDDFTVQGGLTGGETINANSSSFTAGTGGTITTYASGGNTYEVHTFTSSGTFVAPSNSGSGVNVAVLVVAGGGGGGAQGGGGGAGALQYNSSYSTTALQNFSVTVGGGGAGAINPSTTASNGGNSVFGTITSTGGGGGGSNSANSGKATGANGGSGGGQGSTGTAGGSGGSGTTGGNNGGNGYISGGDYGAGGGGGSGAVGSNGTSSAGGAGGAGTSETISGSSVCYAGGGGGGSQSGTGGSATCGGGAGTASNTTAAAGTNGTGGGGGGTGYSSGSSQVGPSGGSGVVIVSYEIPNTTPTLTLASGGATESQIEFNSGNGILSLINNSITSLNFDASGNPYFPVLSTNGILTTSNGTGLVGSSGVNLGTMTNGDLCQYSSSGTIINCNATASGSGTVTSVTLATPNSTLSLGGTNPVTTSGTINADINLSNANTWAAAQKYTKSDLLLLGSSTGATTLNSGLASTSSNTLTLPTTSSDTLAALGTAETWTALQTFGTDISIGGVTAGGATGTGNVVFATSPTLITPALGTPSALMLTNATGLPESGVTSLVASGKTFTANNSITIAGTDSTTMTFPSSSATVAGLGIAQTFTAAQTFDEILNAAEYSNGTCTTSATISPANGNDQKITLTNGDACALSFTQPATTATIRLKIIQSSTSSYNGTISGCKWPSGTAMTPTATSGAVDWVSIELDGTNAYCSPVGQAFS